MGHLAIPKALERFAGRIIDIDSHEMVPAQLWDREFGPVTRDLANMLLQAPPNDLILGIVDDPGRPAHFRDASRNVVDAILRPRMIGEEARQTI